MKSPYSIGWRELRDAEDLAAKAQELFPDRAQPEADREWLRVKWTAAIKTLRKGRGYLLDQRINRITTQEAA